MENLFNCPLCKIPVIIRKGMKMDFKSTHHAARKSQVYCPQCGKTLKEAFLFISKNTSH